MIKIQSKKQFIYDNATQKSATIIIEMIKWEEVSNGIMSTDINYIAKDTVTNAESMISGKSKTIQISIERYNELFLATDALIPSELSPYEKSVLRKKLCLLIYVQNDILDGTDKCIYGSSPNDWELC